MNTPRLPIVVITAALLSTAILALLTYGNTRKAVGSSSSFSGMGDLKRFDAQQDSAPGKVLAVSQPRIGMGDLGRYEASASSPSYTGIGDLQRFEYQQLLPSAKLKGFQLPGRICPNLSSPDGERDSGASAPAYVLLAMGCQVSQ